MSLSQELIEKLAESKTDWKIEKSKELKDFIFQQKKPKPQKTVSKKETFHQKLAKKLRL